MAIHGLTPERILEVLDRPFLMVGNRKGRRASHLIVGRDRTGACISIPVEATAERGIWRPVTAWSCKVHELRKLEQEEN